jgi:hypothetical protein
VAYTAIFGGRDSLKDPTVITPGCRYVCFTDEPLVSEIWEIVRVPAPTDPRRASRFYKLLPHRTFDTAYSVWVDGTFRINVDLWTLIRRHLSSTDLAAFAHTDFDCAYDEADACIRYGLGDPREIRDQMGRYRRAGFPRHAGLWHCGVLLRRHTTAIEQMNEAWWYELGIGSSRDQLSFGYTFWRLGIPVGTLHGVTFQDADLEFLDHRSQRLVSEFDRDEWLQLEPPAAIATFPADLSGTALEYSGIYSDGWLEDTVMVGLLQPTNASHLAVRGMVPLIDEPSFSTDLQVTIGEKVRARTTLGPGDFELEVPVAPVEGRHRVRLHFSDGQMLPERFPRRVSALAFFIGFACRATANDVAPGAPSA